MTLMIKTLTASIALSAFCTMPASADGVDPMFMANGSFIDDLEIIGDVTLPSGEVLAAFEMREQHMKLYIDPAAAYVSMSEDNPVLTQQTPFYGFWISTQSVDMANWPACENEVLDEYGTPYAVHGTLVWTNTGIAENGYELAYKIDLGTCSARQNEWAVSSAQYEKDGGAGVPHNDIMTDFDYKITDSTGNEFGVFADPTENYATLVSVDQREIAVKMADAAQTTQTFFEQEVVQMFGDCAAFSTRRGYGTWAWANGGFVVDFDTLNLSFPRMDAPPNNGGACRI